jgi:COMPASS component BRE2
LQLQSGLMADQQLAGEAAAAAAASPTPFIPSIDHAPSVPSPLNPDASRARPAPKPIAREQREKKETLKKRESTALARGATPDAKAGFKPPPVVGPRRELLPQPELYAYNAPRDMVMVSNEPEPIFAPGTGAELKKPVDW